MRKAQPTRATALGGRWWSAGLVRDTVTRTVPFTAAAVPPRQTSSTSVKSSFTPPVASSKALPTNAPASWVVTALLAVS